MTKIPVGILGATGTVGQKIVRLLSGHPWFDIAFLAASTRSAEATYEEVCHWLLPEPMPENVRTQIVQPLDREPECRLVFSALPPDVAREAEERLAAQGYAVCSNASSHRLDPDVPLLVPEVNGEHVALIGAQRRRRNGKGFIAANPNCSATPLSLVLKPLWKAFGLRRVSVVTMQALSGAGYPGVPGPDILDNLIPYIAGEEDKVEREPRKILGIVQDGRVEEASFVIEAQCNRVAVRDGHTACVVVEFETGGVPPADVVSVLDGFRPPPDVARLPSSPSKPIVVRSENDRPQPFLDRGEGNGMSVVVGRIRPASLFDVKFVLLSHNTVRGAAGGTIQVGELLAAQGWLD